MKISYVKKLDLTYNLFQQYDVKLMYIIIDLQKKFNLDFSFKLKVKIKCMPKFINPKSCMYKFLRKKY